MNDTVLTTTKQKITDGEFIETTLKNNSIVRLYKLKNNKYYLKLIVSENLYFDKIDLLEVQSGTRSYYEKDIKQHELNKSTGYFVFEVYRNYIATLRDEGITAIVFGKVETDFSKQDASQIRHMAKCFYENIVVKK